MGTHPIFESDFDCLTEKVMAEVDTMIAALQDWQRSARPYVTTETMEKQIGNNVTLLGQVTSLEGSQMMVKDGTGNVTVSISDDTFPDENIEEGTFVQITGKATAPAELTSLDIVIVQGEEGTLDLRAKVCKLLEKYPQHFYAK